MIVAFRESKASHGAGVYTSSDVFKDAGISPFLTFDEVFLNPSRLAHIILAYYTFVYKVCKEDGIIKLVHSAVHGTLLAPTETQRLRYAYYLSVYGKELVYCTEREAQLIERYIETISIPSGNWSQHDLNMALYDVFEPSNVCQALMNDGACLGHLVFGIEKWKELSGCCKEALETVTSDMISKKWKLLSGIVFQLLGEVREASLFSTIVKKGTTDVAIGPLEYCGNAVWSRVGKLTVVSPCREDPTLSSFALACQIQGYLRRKNKIDAPEKAKTAMSKSHQLKVSKGITAVLKGPQHLSSSSLALESSPLALLPVQPAKCCRLSADKHLALSGVEIEKENGGSTPSLAEHKHRHST
uniref:Uncharacterized protein n=1 Tax=Moniliophthora roreri TaxID=221103 RepID=A0A0W0F0U1_MONRR